MREVLTMFTRSTVWLLVIAATLVFYALNTLIILLSVNDESVVTKTLIISDLIYINYSTQTQRKKKKNLQWLSSVKKKNENNHNRNRLERIEKYSTANDSVRNDINLRTAIPLVFQETRVQIEDKKHLKVSNENYVDSFPTIKDETKQELKIDGGKYEEQNVKSKPADHRILVRTKLNKLKNQHDNSLQQKCMIPRLDPFHPDVLPYVSYKWKKRCMLKRKAKTMDGKLYFKMRNIQRAGFYYIQRVDDNTNELSEWHPLMNDSHIRLKKGQHGCLVISEHNQVLIGMLYTGKEFNSEIDHQSNVSINVVHDYRPCTKDRHFYINEDHIIIHVKSGRCLLPRDIQDHIKLTLSNYQEECSDDTKFEIKDGGLLFHTLTRKFVVYEGKDSSFRLRPNLHENGFEKVASRIHFAPEESKRFQDTDVAVPLTEEFVKLEIIEGLHAFSEYHMHVVKPYTNTSERKFHDRDEKKKLNIIMFLIDSLSHANAQRMLNNTYKYLQTNPNAFILQGHTIVGDGTTPQLCAMLTGKQEYELPEARRGFPNSKVVDHWPFIWKEFENLGYATLYSEDEPSMGTFQYRLKGFNKTPTTKYLRPSWWAMEYMLRVSNAESPACAHQFAFDYLKDFYKIYSSKGKFSLLNFCYIGHNAPNKIRLMDKDIMDFFTFLSATGDLNNTAVIIFGDHGARTAEFRSTIQGKLEERLPFMTITLPDWFNSRFPREIANLRKNSDVMTSHFDIYATLKHLKDFPNNNFTHKYGKSLFTDIVSLNRTCEDTGIRSHWCPCLDFEDVIINDTIAMTVTQNIVDYINNLKNTVSVAQTMCLDLGLEKIIRVRKRTPNKRVQKFVQTYRDGTCDECGVSEDKQFKLTTFIYEVVFSVLPSHGKYEATAEYRTDKNETVLVNSVSRINLYGDQPKCITKDYPHLRDYCYCKT